MQGPKRSFLLSIVVCVVIDVDWDRLYTSYVLGRGPRTKETLPDVSEKCRVTRHSRVFPQVDG